MPVQITAFRWVPPFAQGYVKDLRIRWALEEAGIAYEVMLIDSRIQQSTQYRQWQPFGQVPAYQDDEVTLFESGAILLHIAAKSEVLAPIEVAGRARVSAWIMAALNSVEPHAQNFIRLEDAPADETWPESHRARVVDLLHSRLAALSQWLSARPYLEERFSAGDLMMTMVLRELVDSGILAQYPNLDALRRRCEERAAFGRALAAQLRTFRENTPVPSGS